MFTVETFKYMKDKVSLKWEPWLFQLFPLQHLTRVQFLLNIWREMNHKTLSNVKHLTPNDRNGNIKCCEAKDMPGTVSRIGLPTQEADYLRWSGRSRVQMWVGCPSRTTWAHLGGWPAQEVEVEAAMEVGCQMHCHSLAKIKHYSQKRRMHLHKQIKRIIVTRKYFLKTINGLMISNLHKSIPEKNCR